MFFGKVMTDEVNIEETQEDAVQTPENIEESQTEDQPAEDAHPEAEFADDQEIPVEDAGESDEDPEPVVEDQDADDQSEETVEENESQDETPEPETVEQSAKEAEFGVHEEGIEPTVASVVESILFASDEPITPSRLAGIVEVGGVKEVKDAVKELNDKYRQYNSAFRVEEIAGGLQLMTLSNYNHWLKKLIRVRGDSKLTQAGLETLAIIAYKQPIIRADVEAIRGVGSGEMIRSLMYKGMVKIAGRAEVLGRPLLYGTTKKFLDMFGLNKLKDLPKVEELKKPE